MPLLGLSMALAIVGPTINVDLTNGEWRPAFLVAFALPAKNKVVVKFSTAGDVSGNGGCNRFSGPYRISDGSIKIGPIVSTRMGCPGTIELESIVFAVLRTAATFKEEGDKLFLFDAAGTELAQFVRSEKSD
jgi:heat shock protein HslJ